VAANEFLDALAGHRRALGLPALSIDWGPWAEIGLAASRSDRGERLADRGLSSFSPEQGLDALGRLLSQDAPRVGVMPFDPERWSEFYPAARRLPRFAGLWGAGSPSGPSPAAGAADDRPLAGRLRHLALAERLEVLRDELSGEVAKVLRLPATRIDPRQPIKRFGLDSLMAVELKHRVETGFGVSVPIVKFLQGLNLADLADLVLEGMDLAGEEPPAPAAAPPAGVAAEQAAHLLARLDQLSDQEVESLLRDLAAEEETPS
jgi:acyl carrier protein